MTTNSRAYSREYMRAKRAGIPRTATGRLRPVDPQDRPDSWPGEGHCRRCHLNTDQPDLCVTCQWEIEQQRFRVAVQEALEEWRMRANRWGNKA